MRIDVVKIGGSLLVNSESYHYIAQKIVELKEKLDSKIVVVVSAMKGVTDDLLRAYNNHADLRRTYEYIEISNDIGGKKLYHKVKNHIDILEKLLSIPSKNPWLRPLVLSFGERISKVILYEALSQYYDSVSSVDATRLIIAENIPDNARILYEETKYNMNRLRYLFNYNDIVVVEGYIASTVNGHTVTLGRGGSDYTAATLSALLRANSLYIYTNVPGILSGDPELIENPRRIPRLDYDEAYEASVHGVKRLHPRTFEPLRKIHAPKVYIGSLNDEYTIIGDYRASHIGLKIITTNTTSNANELTLIGWYRDKQETLTRLTEYLSEHDIEYNAVNFPSGRPLVKISTIGNDVRLMANILHDFIVSEVA